jgi:hypothetical protein
MVLIGRTMNFSRVPRVFATWVLAVAMGCGGDRTDPAQPDAAQPEASTEAGEQGEAGSEPGAETGSPTEAGDEDRSSSEGGDANEIGPDANDVGPVECRAPVHVATSAELEAAVEALDWGMRQLSSSGKNLSGDLIFDADVELVASRVTLPTCGAISCTPLDIHLGDANGTCLETTEASDAGPGPACTRFRVSSGASFRILEVNLLGGFFGAQRPTLLTLPTCKAPCAADQRSCPSYNVCMPAVEPNIFPGGELGREMRSAQGSYCATCLGQTRAQCACFTFDGPKPEGTPCSYDTSDDTAEIGFCRAGRCTRD